LSAEIDHVSNARAIVDEGCGAKRGPSPRSRPELRLCREDVEHIRTGTAQARAHLATKFGRQYDELVGGGTRLLANAVLELLVRDVEKAVRQALAEEVAASPNLPCEIANTLARDDIDVARPILEASPVLTDEDLIDIVRTHALQHALAVAGRERLSAEVADTLVEVGSIEVVRRLAGNAGADFSEKTVRQILADHFADGEVRDRLVRRPALPYELVHKLVGEVGERLEWVLVQERRMTGLEARQLMRAVRETATLGFVAREHAARTLEGEMRWRLAAGELGPETVLRCLRDGAVRDFEAALAVLAGVAVETARRILYGMDKRGIAALCIRAGFGVAHYIALRMVLDLVEAGVAGRSAEVAYSDTNLRFIQRQYEQMLLDHDLVGSLLRE
jgi:uncharacterized protein (DUF2336 family)